MSEIIKTEQGRAEQSRARAEQSMAQGAGPKGRNMTKYEYFVICLVVPRTNHTIP